MDLQNFDSTLKSALQDLEVSYDPGSWEALESRLEQLPAPDRVDNAVRPTLEQIDTAFDPGSWSKLAGRMDQLVQVRKLRLTKLAEAAIFLLLLLNLKGFFGVVQSVTHPTPVKTAQKGPIAKTNLQKSKKAGISAKTDPQNTAALDAGALEDQVIALIERISNGLSMNNGADSQTPSITPVTDITSNASLLDPARFYSQSGLIKFPAGSALPVSPVKPLLYANSGVFIPGFDFPVTPKKSLLYAATYVSLDKNYIQDAAFKDQTSGYGGGFTIGTKKGKWGFETGFAYAQKNYEPKRTNVEYQNDPYNGISFYYVDEVQADMIAIPVKATRKVAKIGSVSAHAMAGLTANFTTNKQYGYQTVHYPPPIPQINPDPNAQPAQASPNGKGLLENGGLQNNFYVSADLGLRVEQAFGKRYIAFVEPAYHQSIAGHLGPNSARINTFSLQAGVMASL